MPTSAQLAEEARRARAIADDLARQAGEAARAEEAARRPKAPEVNGECGPLPVITFSRYMSGRAYHYAAIAFPVEATRGVVQASRVRWVVTGEETRRFTWSGLLNWIGEANWPTLAVAGEFVPLLSADQEPAVAERMGAYGRVLGTDQVPPSSSGARLIESPFT